MDKWGSIDIGNSYSIPHLIIAHGHCTFKYCTLIVHYMLITSEAILLRESTVTSSLSLYIYIYNNYYYSFLKMNKK